MLHSKPTRSVQRAVISRRRVQLLGSLLFSALLPYALRLLITPGSAGDPPALNTFLGNCGAVLIALWVRLSVEPFPGVRSSALNLPVATASHAIVVVAIVLLRVPYDRSFLLAGYGMHLVWLYLTYFIVQRRSVVRIAVVPFGKNRELVNIVDLENVEWREIRRPLLKEAENCQAIVADFHAAMSPEWEAFLADAAVGGWVVYQVKQLSESLTGRVEIAHISENSFGSLMPARGYFHFKEMLDLLTALLALPLVLPVIAVVAVAIRLEGKGPVFFRQDRIGHGGRTINVLKFRTMLPYDQQEGSDERLRAMTGIADARVTQLGRVLRHSRVDELPQIWNILMGEMSWIGPRPEAQILSDYYTGLIPFYRYRHVVKPGISGWAQVNQGHVAEVDDVIRKLQYDFYYIKYFSPWLDFLILFRTVKTMLTGFGSR